jgi:hypothetical protein
MGVTVEGVRLENPHEAWQKLKDEFEPSQIVDVADLQIEFSNVTFNSYESDPIDWIEKLEQRTRWSD